MPASIHSKSRQARMEIIPTDDFIKKLMLMKSRQIITAIYSKSHGVLESSGLLYILEIATVLLSCRAIV